MGKLEVFQNGNFSDGRPVFQVGSKNEDGTYVVVNANLMSEEEANAALAELQPAPKKEAAPKKAPVKKVTAKKK
tara:strand:- start:209 stop:430 length:222 start_codon:yes stop_codon:yes gene_type:complete